MLFLRELFPCIFRFQPNIVYRLSCSTFCVGVSVRGGGFLLSVPFVQQIYTKPWQYGIDRCTMRLKACAANAVIGGVGVVSSFLIYSLMIYEIKTFHLQMYGKYLYAASFLSFIFVYIMIFTAL